MFRLAFCLLVIFLPVSSPAFAAKVKMVKKSNKTIGISGGAKQGFTKGQKVCFFKAKKKVACGKVIKTKPNKAIVKVKKRFGKIKKGFRAELASSATQKKDGAKNPAAKESTFKGPYSYAVRGLWLPYPTAATPATYQLITYNGRNSQSGESMWVSDTPYSGGEGAAIMGSFGGEVELAEWSLRAGFRYKQFTSYPTDSDYDPSNNSIFLKSELSASAVGFFFDYYWMFSGFSAGLGLDFDITSVTLIATQQDDNGQAEQTELYNLSGSATILSLRIPARYDLFFDPVGITAGLNLMVPLTALSSEVTAEVNDSKNGSKNPNQDDPSQDIITALALGPGGLSIELVIGAFIAF